MSSVGVSGTKETMQYSKRIVPSRGEAPSWFSIAICISTIFYLVVVLHLPVAILAAANFDDGLFFGHALQLLHGHWLGTFSQMTLAKGPGYPLFLALNGLFGLPITLTQTLLYASACGLVGFTLLRISGSPIAAMAAFLVMEWHPSMPMDNIIRDDVSGSQVLLILGFACRFLFVAESRQRQLLWAVLGGLVLGWFRMTREDAIWIVPGLTLLLLGGLLRASPIQGHSRRMTLLVACFVASSFVPQAIVATINRAVYGSFEVVDFNSAAFTKALDVLQSVRVGPAVPHVPVPQAVREAVAAVSPSFAKVNAYLQGAGRGWTAPGCAIYPATCSDFAGGWFVWALRDAVAAQGAYSSPRKADAFYLQLWREVHAACEAGTLTCRRSIVPFMPAMRRSQWAGLPAEVKALAGLGLSQRPLERAPPSTGDVADINQAMHLLRNPIRTWTTEEVGTLSLSGWYVSPMATWIRIRCDGRDGTLVQTIPHRPSPDLAGVFHDPRASADRFAISVPSSTACGLESLSGGQAGSYRSFATLQPGENSLAGGKLYFDSIMPNYAANLGATSYGFLEALNKVYGFFAPAATLLALVIYAGFGLWALARRRFNDLGPLFLWASVVWLLLLTRGAVLVLVSLSAFPAVTTHYWAAGFPLLWLGIILSLAAVTQGVRDRDRGQVEGLPAMRETV